MILLTIYLGVLALYIIYYGIVCARYFHKYKGLPLYWKEGFAAGIFWPIIILTAMIYYSIWLALLQTKYNYLVDNGWFEEYKQKHSQGNPWLRKFFHPTNK